MRKKRGIPMYAAGGNMVPVEVEGGEMAQMPNGQTMEFSGPNHESGGVPAVLPENTEIYSKRIKINGESMADRKKTRERKLNRLTNLFKKDPTNPLAQNTVKRSAQVIAMQEQMDRAIMEKANPVMRNQIEQSEESEQPEQPEQTLSPQAPPPAVRRDQQYWTGGGVMAGALSGVGSGPSTGGGFDLSSDAAQKNIAGLPWGALGTGLASIAMQLAHGEYEKVDSPLLTETEGLRPYAGGGKAKHWIQKAVNPKHKGYCTPMTKKTCTPRRKAFAKTMKKHHGFHAGGGRISPLDMSPQDLGYQTWRSGLPSRLRWEGDYDLRGYYDKYAAPGKAVRGENVHLTDEFKLPNHETFSNESIYYKGQQPGVGGYWDPTPIPENLDLWMYKQNPKVGPPVAPIYAGGGGLSRDQDYGSEKKPYPSVSKGDFAGGGRSYPIPTKADAVDALRLAGLHGREDVRAKVFAKYPELKKAYGGRLKWL
jgi:hypothetical protein